MVIFMSCVVGETFAFRSNNIVIPNLPGGYLPRHPLTLVGKSHYLHVGHRTIRLARKTICFLNDTSNTKLLFYPLALSTTSATLR